MKLMRINERSTDRSAVQDRSQVRPVSSMGPSLFAPDLQMDYHRWVALPLQYPK